MVIVIECESCHSRFRLSKALFKESKAIRVRCRKCGGYIVVENPDLPDVVEEGQRSFPRAVQPPPPEPEPEAAREPERVQEPEPPRKREPEPQEEPPPAAREPEARAEAPPPEAPSGEKPFPMDETAKAMAELLNELDATGPPGTPAGPDLPPELLPPDAGRKPVSRGAVKVTPSPDPPDGSEALASALEELFKAQTPARPASAPGPQAKAAEPRKPALQQELPRVPAARPPYASPLFIFVVILWLLLLAGAALFFGTDYFDRWFQTGKAHPAGSAAAKKALARHPYEVRDLNWFTEGAFEGGTFFAVTGTVRNLGKPISHGLLVRATIMGKDNTVISEKTVFAGNRLDNTTLRAMKEENVDGFLSKRDDPGSPNLEVPTGGAVPFMAVFFNPPEQVHAVLVKATPGQAP